MRFIYLAFLLLTSACVVLPEQKKSEDISFEVESGPALEALKRVIAASSCSKISWANRGKAPAGYTVGMGLTYAKTLCKSQSWKAKTAAGLDSNPEAVRDVYDALSWYNSNFRNLGVAQANPLKNLYTLGLGLGMRESSGKYCEGRDASATNTSSDTAEAGMFQTSWNAAGAHPELKKIYAFYKANPKKCLLEEFKVGVSCSAQNLKNYGSGEGLEYQKLAKSCPAFATEFAMLTLRVIRKHYGPINRKEAELKSECYSMLSDVETFVAKLPEVCDTL